MRYAGCTDRMKKKRIIIILINAEKAFDKFQHPFLIKTINKVGTKGKFLNTVRVTKVTNPQHTQ
jgi:hypothetical protein